jgi:LysM repeat protein
MKSKSLSFFIICILALGMVFLQPFPVKASTSITPSDLINLINSWRVNTYGFAPLTVDPILMGTAQYTAQFMAENNLRDHMANLGYGGVPSRIALAGYNGGIITCATENWAYAYNSIEEIAEVWSDAAHQYPASKEQYKNVGAGVALDSEGRPYFVIHAACASSGSSSGSLQGTVVPGSTLIATVDNSIHAVVTATPQSDGAIYHTVEPGQTLWSIAVAYNTHIDIIKKLNSLSTDIVFTGQKLLIMQAPTPTVSPTITSTPIPPTRTPTHPVTPRPPTPTFTPSPTATPTSMITAIPGLTRHNLGLLIIIICAIGLLAVIAVSLVRRPVPQVAPQKKSVKNAPRS